MILGRRRRRRAAQAGQLAIGARDPRRLALRRRCRVLQPHPQALLKVATTQMMM